MTITCQRMKDAVLKGKKFKVCAYPRDGGYYGKRYEVTTDGEVIYWGSIVGQIKRTSQSSDESLTPDSVECFIDYCGYFTLTTRQTINNVVLDAYEEILGRKDMRLGSWVRDDEATLHWREKVKEVPKDEQYYNPLTHDDEDGYVDHYFKWDGGGLNVSEVIRKVEAEAAAKRKLEEVEPVAPIKRPAAFWKLPDNQSNGKAPLREETGQRRRGYFSLEPKSKAFAGVMIQQVKGGYWLNPNQVRSLKKRLGNDDTSQFLFSSFSYSYYRDYTDEVYLVPDQEIKGAAWVKLNVEKAKEKRRNRGW